MGVEIIEGGRAMRIGGREVEFFPAMTAGAPLVVLNGEAGEGAAVCEAARALTGADFALAAVSDIDWNAELTPWPAPPAFRRGEPFSGRADDYLAELTGAILPGIAKGLPEPPAWVGLAGYSLAGLFALYAPYRTDAFARVASVSGSLWYPGFPEFARENAWARKPERIYLSVGDREGATRNPVMRPVEENTRAVAALCAERGATATFELNPGGHFDAPEARLARGIAWILAE